MGQNQSNSEQELTPVIHENGVGSEYLITGRELRILLRVPVDELGPFLASKIATMDFDTSHITKCPTNEGYLLFLCKKGAIKGKIVVTVRKFIPRNIMIDYCKEFCNIQTNF